MTALFTELPMIIHNPHHLYQMCASSFQVLTKREDENELVVALLWFFLKGSCQVHLYIC